MLIIFLCWIVTLDVLKCFGAYTKLLDKVLNSNIRCIEINRDTLQDWGASWIVTLDVLKWMT